MSKKMKNDVTDSTSQKSFLDKFMEEFLKEEKEFDFTEFYDLLEKCFVKDCKTNLKNFKINCLEGLKEQMQENIYNKEHEIIMDAVFLLFADALLFWFLLSPIKSLLFLMLLEVIFVVSKIWKTKNIVKGTKEAILYLEETILEEKQELENRKQKELEEIKDREERITEDKLDLILNKAEFFFDYGLNYKKWKLFYKMGKLRNRLEEKYTEEDCDKIENWLACDTFKEEENSLLRKLER